MIAAFFDIDGTIYRESLIKEVFKKMVKYEMITEETWQHEVRPLYLKWDARQGDYDTYLLKMVEVYTETVKSVSPNHIKYIAKKIIEQRGDRVYTFSRDRIHWHKSQGHKVIAISGSPIELVKEMSNKYEMDDYKGTIYLLDRNTYTGEVIPMWDSNSKSKAITEMVKKYDIDLSKSYAYGDTTGDFSMLQQVGNPYAVNPTRELLNKVTINDEMRKKITVIIQRKDVIYKLSTDELHYTENSH
ncbi:MAG: haloacid dehalogenase [Candidatus Epulonipiscium fishelsonii]|nr:MAG: haloacid dehalogenase [Epulopiscium sp. AS2M-Bin002]